MSSECNNVKLDIRNDKSEGVYAMCKQCLITANHDVCVLNYVNDMNSRGKKQKANVSYTDNQKKQKPEVKKPKKVGFKERLASPTPSEPSISHRNLIANGFQIPLLFLAGTVHFGNDHVAAILGYDLEVAFRRNTCFVRNLEGVDLLKGNRITNLYTINLHDMASASLIYLMASATSTKSWKEKSKRASHPPKPVPNSKQRLHLLHMDLYDEALEVIKTFLKKIIVLLQDLVIMARTDNGTKFKNQVLQEYFNSVGISHQASSYQAKPTKKYLKEVKRIFCYLWGTFNMGLWYTKDYGFEVTGFSDAGYAGCKTPSRVLLVELNS
ncbi:putative ribonuclease H-like domain-containing protein [Tanacetum coccineum]